MKLHSTIRPGFFALLASLAITACDSTPKGDKADISEKKEAADVTGQTFMVDTANSSIRFTGHGVGKNHPGKFKLSSGTVAVANNQITGGNFVVNIKSMDLEQEGEMF